MTSICSNLLNYEGELFNNMVYKVDGIFLRMPRINF